MVTSQNNIQLIEKYLLGGFSPADKFLFEAKLILNPELRKELSFQKKTYKLVRMYHRQRLKEELEEFHQRIFSDPKNMNFRQTIFQIFKR